MITGFNTDIEFGGITYHVQTEDKGLDRPLILSLVYDRGTILASKRQSYKDLLGDEFDEKLLAERLQKQHRLMCAAVRAGRIEDLIKMTAKEAEADRAARSSKKAYRPAPEAVTYPETDAPIPKPPQPGAPLVNLPEGHDDLIIEDASIIDEFLIPDEAVEIISEMQGRERPTNNRLTIEVLGDSKFTGGKPCTVNFMILRGSERKVVEKAEIMVKVMGSSFRPRIFHASTDVNGLAKLNIEVPSFTSGRAAVVVRAISDGEEVEFRRPVANGQ